MTDRERFIEDFRHKFYKAIGNWETEIYMTADEARNVLQELESQSATLEKSEPAADLWAAGNRLIQ